MTKKTLPKATAAKPKGKATATKPKELKPTITCFTPKGKQAFVIVENPPQSWNLHNFAQHARDEILRAATNDNVVDVTKLTSMLESLLDVERGPDYLSSYAIGSMTDHVANDLCKAATEKLLLDEDASYDATIRFAHHIQALKVPIQIGELLHNSIEDATQEEILRDIARINILKAGVLYRIANDFLEPIGKMNKQTKQPASKPITPKATATKKPKLAPKAKAGPKTKATPKTKPIFEELPPPKRGRGRPRKAAAVEKFTTFATIENITDIVMTDEDTFEIFCNLTSRGEATRDHLQDFFSSPSWQQHIKPGHVEIFLEWALENGLTVAAGTPEESNPARGPAPAPGVPAIERQDAAKSPDSTAPELISQSP